MVQLFPIRSVTFLSFWAGWSCFFHHASFQLPWSLFYARILRTSLGYCNTWINPLIIVRNINIGSMSLIYWLEEYLLDFGHSHAKWINNLHLRDIMWTKVVQSKSIRCKNVVCVQNWLFGSQSNLHWIFLDISHWIDHRILLENLIIL